MEAELSLTAAHPWNNFVLLGNLSSNPKVGFGPRGGSRSNLGCGVT